MDYRIKHNIYEPIRFLRGTVDPMAYWFKCSRHRSNGGAREEAPAATCGRATREALDAYELRSKENVERLHKGGREVLAMEEVS